MEFTAEALLTTKWHKPLSLIGLLDRIILALGIGHNLGGYLSLSASIYQLVRVVACDWCVGFALLSNEMRMYGANPH